MTECLMDDKETISVTSFIRIQCELYRALIREHQKDTEKEIFSIQKQLSKNEEFELIKERLEKLLEHREKNKELELEELLVEVLDFTPTSKISSVILDFLLRKGYVDSAALYAPNLSKKIISSIASFWNQLNGIVQGGVENPHHRWLSSALSWLEKAKKSSFKLPEGIELLLRIQEYRQIESKMEALEYAQTYFPSLTGMDTTFSLNAIRKAMTLLARSELPSTTPNQEDNKLKSLAILFKTAVCQSFGTIPLKSPLQIYLEAGLASLKSPHCQATSSALKSGGEIVDTSENKTNYSNNCPICSDQNLYSLTEALPCAKHDSSQIICRISGDVISGGGPSDAICLPNGQVYSEKAIAEPDSEGYITCPLTGEKFPKDQIKKIYFL